MGPEARTGATREKEEAGGSRHGEVLGCRWPPPWSVLRLGVFMGWKSTKLHTCNLCFCMQAKPKKHHFFKKQIHLDALSYAKPKQGKPVQLPIGINVFKQPASYEEQGAPGHTLPHPCLPPTPSLVSL